MVRTNPQSGRLTANNFSLKAIIQFAYAVQGQGFLQNFQISGGPKWIDSDRYDIIAKAEHSPTPEDQLMVMLQTLLSDRFKLKFHWESKETPGYVSVGLQNSA